MGALHLARWSAPALLSCAACVPETDAVRLKLVERFVLVAAYGPGTEVHVQAGSLPEGSGELSIPVQSPLTYAAAYSCPLDSLGFALPPVVGAAGQLLPWPSRVLSLEGDAHSSWHAEPDLLATGLSSLRLRGGAAAKACDQAQEEDAGSPSPEWMLPVDSRRALVGDSAGMLLLEEGGRAERLQGTDGVALGGFIAEDGGIVLARGSGLLQGSLQGGFTSRPLPICTADPCPFRTAWLDGSAEDLYLLGADGVLVRIENGTRSELARARGPVQRGAVVRLPGGALVLGLDGDRLKRVRGGAISDVEPPLDRATALDRAWLADGSDAVLAATPAGEVYRMQLATPEEWTLMASPGGPIQALATSGATSWVARPEGVEQLRDDGVGCAPRGGAGSTLGLVALGAAELVRLTEQKAGGPRLVIRLELSAGRRACMEP